MEFSSPVSFDEALAALRAKGLLPTHLSSGELRSLSQEVRGASIFSARMTQVRAVQAMRDATASMLAGRANLADAKLRLLNTLLDLGYTPDAGFPQDPAGLIPEADPGSLQDLLSTRRRELQLRTQYRMAANVGKIEAETDDSLWQFPAWELVRFETRRVPRGSPLSGSAGWPARWIAAGGELAPGERMIAAKDSDIWRRLGNGAGGFDDAIGNPYAPFAYGSGWDVRDVSRAEAVEVGAVAPGEMPGVPDANLTAALEADASGIDPDLLAEVARELEEDDGQIRLREMLDAEVALADEVYLGNRARGRLATLRSLIGKEVSA